MRTHPLSSSISLTNGFIVSSLTCEADEAISYNWERQSGSIPSGAIGVNTNTLTIINLQPEDAGNYRCVAANSNGNVTSNYATININGKSVLYFCLALYVHPVDMYAELGVICFLIINSIVFHYSEHVQYSGTAIN